MSFVILRVLFTVVCEQKKGVDVLSVLLFVAHILGPLKIPMPVTDVPVNVNWMVQLALAASVNGFVQVPPVCDIPAIDS